MKQIYVNEYLKFAMENGFGGEHLDRGVSGTKDTWSWLTESG